MREFFKKYQNLTSPQGELNLNFLKNPRVQINFKLNEESRMQGSPKCGIIGGGNKIEVEGEIGTSREVPVASSPRKILKIYNT